MRVASCWAPSEVKSRRQALTRRLQQKLHRIGQVAFAWVDPHVALTSAALLGPDDVAVGISHSGVTQDTVDPLAQAQANGVTTIAITNFPRSALASIAHHVLTTAARETTFRSGATASRLAQLTVVDCIFGGSRSAPTRSPSTPSRSRTTR